MKKLLMPLVVLIMAAMLSVVQYYAVTETYKDWMKTTAVITDIQITDRRRHAGKWIHYYWNYNIDGVTYSGHDFFAYSEQKYMIGDEKEIWYNPADHSESQHKAHTKRCGLCVIIFTYSNRRSFQTYRRDNQAEAVHQGPYR